MIALPFLAFLVVYGVNFFKAQGVEGINISEIFLPYLGFVALMVAVAYFTIENAAKMLFAFSISAMACMIGGYYIYYRTYFDSFIHEWRFVVFGDVAVYFFAID